MTSEYFYIKLKKKNDIEHFYIELKKTRGSHEPVSLT